MVKVVRLYSGVTIDLFQPITLSSTSAHYLQNVMRRKKGDKVIVFDGKSGEYEAEIKYVSKGTVTLEPKKKLAEISKPEDIWVAFTPIKKIGTHFVIEKCTEIGVRKIFPIFTEHSVNKNLRIGKWKLNSIEAVEQCGGNFIPEIRENTSLAEFIDNFPEDRKLIFCNEVAKEPNLREIFAKDNFSKACFLIGPEGGFSDKEREMLSRRKNVYSVSLGARILRAETAVTVALAVWHSHFST